MFGARGLFIARSAFEGVAGVEKRITMRASVIASDDLRAVLATLDRAPVLIGRPLFRARLSWIVLQVNCAARRGTQDTRRRFGRVGRRASFREPKMRCARPC